MTKVDLSGVPETLLRTLSHRAAEARRPDAVLHDPLALLPESSRRRVVAGSALDFAWMDAVDPAPGVLITAQGLLMYFQREQADALIARCAERFPGGTLLFDAPLLARLAPAALPRIFVVQFSA